MEKNQIIKKTILNHEVTKLTFYNEDIAKKAYPGQFIILRVDAEGERIPLTIAGYDRVNGLVTIIFQIIGATTYKLNQLNEKDIIETVCGPLGNKTNLDNINKLLVISGGVGCAICYPICKHAKEKNIYVDAISGFKTKDLVILEEEFSEVCDNYYVSTDDGSYGYNGFVTGKLNELLEHNTYDLIIVIGSLLMMKYCAQTTKKYNIKTICSMNPIMIDGSGMCGCCRVTVDGKMKFACVDGPDFDAHKVDFDEAINRSKAYIEFEQKQRDEHCNLFKKEVQ